ncbi:hypothetical protein FCM35_KLT08526 [Carex littledalei]|uniref:Uncharacterized protein n=1 Tax=Carex littledalei TaxID=544730 RepID=A0A833QRT2_9POAL|nr:hypothetical protein FCM35_KLT08526 [Carex littledalei]
MRATLLRRLSRARVQLRVASLSRTARLRVRSEGFTTMEPNSQSLPNLQLDQPTISSHGQSTDLSNPRSTEISPNANFGLTETHSFGYSTQLLTAMHALSTTNSSLLDSRMPATPYSLAGQEK